MNQLPPQREVLHVPEGNFLSGFDGVSLQQSLLPLVKVSSEEGAKQRHDAGDGRKEQNDSHQLKEENTVKHRLSIQRVDHFALNFTKI